MPTLRRPRRPRCLRTLVYRRRCELVDCGSDASPAVFVVTVQTDSGERYFVLEDHRSWSSLGRRLITPQWSYWWRLSEYPSHDDAERAAALLTGHTYDRLKPAPVWLARVDGPHDSYPFFEARLGDRVDPVSLVVSPSP